MSTVRAQRLFCLGSGVKSDTTMDPAASFPQLMRFRVTSLIVFGAIMMLFRQTSFGEQIYGLTLDSRLFSFDSAAPGNRTIPMVVTGLSTDPFLRVDFNSDPSQNQNSWQPFNGISTHSQGVTFSASSSLTSGNVQITLTSSAGNLSSRDRGGPSNAGAFTLGQVYRDFATTDNNSSLLIDIRGLIADKTYEVKFYSYDHTAQGGTTTFMNARGDSQSIQSTGTVTYNGQFSTALAATANSYGIIQFFATANPNDSPRLNGLELAVPGSLAAIDFRPATGQLYGLAYSTPSPNDIRLQLCIIDPQTAAANPLGTSFQPSYGSGTPTIQDFAFDFDPVADRARVISSLGQNFLVRPGGTVPNGGVGNAPAYDQSGPNAGAPASIVAMAYTNNVAGATATTLYGYNHSLNQIVTIGGLNGSPGASTGRLFAVGNSGVVSNSRSLGMDISGSTGIAYLNADAGAAGSNDQLFTMNLATGAVTSLGNLGPVLDIAVKQNPPATPAEQTLVATDLPQAIPSVNSCDRTLTEFEVPYAPTMSLYVEVWDPSPKDVDISIFPSSTIADTFLKDIRTLPGNFPLKVWDHEPLLDPSGQPIMCTDEATGQQKPCIRATILLPQYGPDGQRFLGDDRYSLQVLHDVTGSCRSSATIGTLAKARLNLNPAPHPPPVIQLYGSDLNQPVPQTIDYGQPLDLLLSASTSASHQINRLSLTITGPNLDRPLMQQILTSGATASLRYQPPFLPSGTYQVTAKAFDETGFSRTTSTSITVKKLIGLFSVLGLTRTLDAGSSCGQFGGALQSVNFSANLELKNLTGLSSGNLRIRLVELEGFHFTDEVGGFPTSPSFEPTQSFVGPVSPLLPNSGQLVAVSGKIRPPTACPGTSPFVGDFHIYAILEEESQPGQWFPIDAIKVADGEQGINSTYGGPGGGDNDPPVSLSGTTWDPYLLSSLAITGPLSVTEPAEAQYLATVTYKSTTQTVTKPLVPDPRLKWSASSPFVISSNGVLQPQAVTSDTSAEIRAEFTLGGVTRSQTYSVNIHAPAPTPTPTASPVPTPPPIVTSPIGDQSIYAESTRVLDLTAFFSNPNASAATRFGAALSTVNSTRGAETTRTTQVAGLEFSVSSNNQKVATVRLSGTNLFISNKEQLGTAQITVTASAPEGASVSQTFNVTAADGPCRLLNISTRANFPTGNEVLIGGFFIGKGTGKRLVVRAIGPSLATQIANALPDPVIEVYHFGDKIAENDSWATDSKSQLLHDLDFAPSSAREAALIVDTPAEIPANPDDNSGYTVKMQSATRAPGVGLVEVYDLESGPEPALLNLSTRGAVGVGENVLIGGLILRGNGQRRVILRALGPSLAASVSGVLPDPQLELRDIQGTRIDSNDNWPANPNAAEIQARGFAPPDPKESAIIINLGTGAYTAVISGAGAQPTGVALIEAYQVE